MGVDVNTLVVRPEVAGPEGTKFLLGRQGRGSKCQQQHDECETSIVGHGGKQFHGQCLPSIFTSAIAADLPTGNAVKVRRTN